MGVENPNGAVEDPEAAPGGATPSTLDGDRRENRFMTVSADRLTSAIADAGYGSQEPVIIGVYRQGSPVFVAQGLAGADQPLNPAIVAYAASLSKQITAACAAILVREGTLDIDSTLKSWLPELPAWAGTIRLHHLLHHTAAIPDHEVDTIVGRPDRTTSAVLAALSQIPALATRPGSTYSYSNSGYVCLAAVVERATSESLDVWVETRIFAPLGMGSTCYWPGPGPAPPGATPLPRPHPAPLSLGDGGIWSSPKDLLRWAQALNADELGISRLMETPGRLEDGTVLDYAWGMGIRSHAGYRVYRHGGGWTGLRALLARVPELDVGLVIMALADDSERRIDLAATVLDLVTGPQSD